MARKVFYSFHFDNDCWRTSQVRNIGSIEGNKPTSDNTWEEVKRGGDVAIQRWIDNEMKGRSCVVVLVGTETAGRKWVQYEIKKGWESGLGIVGIRIHKLKNQAGESTLAGGNPFSSFNINSTSFANIATLYDPPGYDSKEAYGNIALKIDGLVESAIALRATY